MAIVLSMSVSENTLESLNRIQERLSLKGRSETIRAAVHMAEAELMKTNELDGPVEGVLVIIHRAPDDPWINEFENKYRQNIKTHIRSHLRDGRCHEVMIFSTEISELRKMTNELHGTKKVDYMNFVKSG